MQHRCGDCKATLAADYSCFQKHADHLDHADLNGSYDWRVKVPQGIPKIYTKSTADWDEKSLFFLNVNRTKLSSFVLVLISSISLFFISWSDGYVLEI